MSVILLTIPEIDCFGQSSNTKSCSCYSAFSNMQFQFLALKLPKIGVRFEFEAIISLENEKN